MIRSLSLIGAAIVLVLTVSAVLVEAPTSEANSSLPYQFLPYHTLTQQQQQFIHQQRQIELRQRGAKPSYSFRQYGKVRRQITWPTPIQHVVVIDMENRTVDNLFSGYYNAQWQNSPTLKWQDEMNIANPMGSQFLTRNGLGARFDPRHRHIDFLNEAYFCASNSFNFPCEVFTCPGGNCVYPPMGQVTGYSYVPTIETSVYASFIQNYASADDVVQGNQGPSMPAHQYLIAGQSGAIPMSMTAPFALADNPVAHPLPQASGNDAGPDPEEGENIPYCGGMPRYDTSLDMTKYFPEKVDLNQVLNPCETYGNGTILDEMVGALANPPSFDWQYIAEQVGGYWAAPTSVAKLYSDWHNKYPINDYRQSFIDDPNAYNFYQNITNGNPSPPRPFAALTYLTPCANESDHADTSGNNIYGPDWVGTIVNAIGNNTTYWNHTAIIVTWDDWGGWYDHMGWVESANNQYTDFMHMMPNPHDPNEWGLRVPMIVISPYAISKGYVSHGPYPATLAAPVARSQGAILNLIETIFQLPSLSADDLANQYYDAQHNLHTDDLSDMFNFGQSANPFVAASVDPNYHLPAPGPTNSPCPLPH